MRHERAFDFRRTQSMSDLINNIVDAAQYPEITTVVAPRAVAREVNSFDLRPILLFVAFVVAPDRPQHRRPRSLDHEVTACVSADRLAVTRHDVDVDAGERFGCGTGRGRHHDA